MDTRDQLKETVKEFLKSWSYSRDLKGQGIEDEYRIFCHGIMHLVIETGNLMEVMHMVDHADLRSEVRGDHFNPEIIADSLGKMFVAVLICTKFAPTSTADQMLDRMMTYLD